MSMCRCPAVSCSVSVACLGSKGSTASQQVVRVVHLAFVNPAHFSLTGVVNSVVEMRSHCRDIMSHPSHLTSQAYSQHLVDLGRREHGSGPKRSTCAGLSH